MDCELVGWCALKPEVQAAWFQAVASVVAIVLALLVPALQSRSTKKQKTADDHANSVAAAAQMLPHVQDIGRLIAAILREESPMSFGGESGPIGPLAQQLINHKSVDILSGSLRSLGDAREKASAVVFNIYRARELAETEADHARVRSYRKFYERLMAAQTASSQCLDKIDIMFTGHVGDYS